MQLVQKELRYQVFAQKLADLAPKQRKEAPMNPTLTLSERLSKID